MFNIEIIIYIVYIKCKLIFKVDIFIYYQYNVGLCIF